MPTYVYRVKRFDGSLGESLEVVQSIRDAPLRRHPRTGEPVVRIPQVPMIGRSLTEHAGGDSTGCCRTCKA
jgi:predicted nucleic acid-binding Zn ribbon protein